MNQAKTRYKFLGKPVFKFEVIGATFLRGVAGPFCATVEPSPGKRFSGRISINILGADNPPTPFVTKPHRHPGAALREMEAKAREVARAAQRATRAS